MGCWKNRSRLALLSLSLSDFSDAAKVGEGPDRQFLSCPLSAVRCLLAAVFVVRSRQDGVRLLPREATGLGSSVRSISMRTGRGMAAGSRSEWMK